MYIISHDYLKCHNIEHNPSLYQSFLPLLCLTFSQDGIADQAKGCSQNLSKDILML